MKIFKSHHPFWQFIRSMGSSLTSFALDFGLLIFLVEVVSLHYLIATAVGFTAGTTLNYIISDRWVFKKKKVKTHKAGYTLFFIISLLVAALNIGVMYLCTDIIGLYYIVSRVIAGSTIFIVSFTLRKWVVFH